MICIYTTATRHTEHQNDFRDFKPEGIDRQFINDSGGQHSRSPTMYTATVFSLRQGGQLPVIGVQGLNLGDIKTFSFSEEMRSNVAVVEKDLESFSFKGFNATTMRQSSPVTQRHSRYSSACGRTIVQKRREVVNMNGNIHKVSGTTQRRKYRYV